ncbi:MAG: transglutaminase domain-containing protein [Saprospiraceae bacterium]
MTIRLIFFLLLIAQLGFAQSDLVEKTIQQIPFSEDTIKSVYDWVTDNIKYDVHKLNELKKGSKSNKNSKFKSEEEYKAHLLKKVIKSKKGVCEDYALLFNAIVQKLGYESFIVEGYTKTDEGKIISRIGHAWNAVKVRGKWSLYDPTWGAGYIEEEKRFVKKYSPKWYDVDAQGMIKNHMPFDPVWQISKTPMSYEDFEQNRVTESKEVNYDFDNLIEQSFKAGRKEQMQHQVNRSLEMGEGVRLIERWRRRMTKDIGLYGITSQQDLLEEAAESSNSGVELFNEYIKAKNKQFKGKRWSIEKASRKLENSKEEIESALAIYKSIDVEDKRAVNALNRSIRQSDKLLKQIDKEFAFLEKIK